MGLVMAKKDFLKEMGISKKYWKSYLEGIMDIEADKKNPYGAMGGAGKKFAGAFQMGKPAMMDAVRHLGIKIPSQKEFLSNPDLQKKMYKAYTYSNFKALMRLSPQFRNMSPEERVRVLPRAQLGVGNLIKDLKKGTDFKDQFGTPSSRFQEAIQKRILNNEESIKKEKPNKSIMGPLQNLQLNRGPASIEPPQTMGIQTMEKRPNEEVISKDATVRKKVAQQAESVMPGSGKEIEDKQSWENLKNDEKAGKVLSPMQNFMKGMSHFTPELIAGSLGGWATGPQAAAKMMEPLRSSGEDSIEERRLQLSKGNLALRIEDLKEQRKRTSNLEEDRALRREKAATERTLQLQNYFGKRKDVQDLVKQRDLLNDIDNIIQGAPELAAGVIDFKIAKGIAGEVGNLTNEERASAQISPSFYRKIKRGGVKFLQGKLPEEDIKELRKATKALRAKTGNNFKDKISNFVKGRQLYAEPKAFEEALMAEHGFSGESEQGRKESLVNKYYKK